MSDDLCDALDYGFNQWKKVIRNYKRVVFKILNQSAQYKLSATEQSMESSGESLLGHDEVKIVESDLVAIWGGSFQHLF